MERVKIDKKNVTQIDILRQEKNKILNQRLKIIEIRRRTVLTKDTHDGKWEKHNLHNCINAINSIVCSFPQRQNKRRRRSCLSISYPTQTSLWVGQMTQYYYVTAGHPNAPKLSLCTWPLTSINTNTALIQSSMQRKQHSYWPLRTLSRLPTCHPAATCTMRYLRS